MFKRYMNLNMSDTIADEEDKAAKIQREGEKDTTKTNAQLQINILKLKKFNGLSL